MPELPNPTPSELVRKFRSKNLVVLGSLVTGVFGIYFYTMHSISKSAFSSEELNLTVKDK